MAQDKSKKGDEQIKQYQDPNKLIPKNLELGLWLASRKHQIIRWLTIILAVVAAALVIYSLYGYIYYFTIGQEQDRTMHEGGAVIDISDYRLQTKPLDLKVGTAKALASDNGTDFSVRLSNPNDKQYAAFEFCFVSGDQELCGGDFILPQEEKEIISLNSSIPASGNVKFEITKIYWQKLRAGEVPDWNAFKNQRLNFVFEDVKFSTYSNDVAYLEFSVTNNSAYSYFAVPLDIIVRRADGIAALNRYVVQDLNSRSRREVRLLWPEGAAARGQVEIVPALNILDNRLYKPYTATTN